MTSVVAPQPERVVLVSTRAVLTQPDNSLVLSPATLVLSPATGKIESVTPKVLPPSAFPTDGTTHYVDYSPNVLMPGLVDAHVHLNEPGRTEWEGFYTGTRAAASGGVTTVIDMPLNAIPPTTTLAGFRTKLAAAEGQCWVDVGFFGGIVPGNAGELLPLVDAGVRGFKGFLIHSGVDEFPAVAADDIALAMDTLRDADTTLMFHAEMEPKEPVAIPAVDSASASLTSYNTFLASRPPAFETCALEQIVQLAPRAPRLPLHIVHLSATEGIPILRAARERGIHITAETCFHYLGLAAEAIPDGDTRHKCCPPIRSQINQDGLWAELARPDSVIRTIVSDHSPCTPELKLLPGILAAPHVTEAAFMRHSDSGVDMSISDDDVDMKEKDSETTTENVNTTAAAMPVPAVRNIAVVDEAVSMTPPALDAPGRGDFFAAWGGISSVGLGLSILHTASQARLATQQHQQQHQHPSESVCCSSKHLAPPPTLLDIVRLCSQATAQQVGLAHRKGGLRAGLDADICVFDDALVWTLQTGDMRWKNRCSPWEGHTFQGRVRSTWLRGREIFTLGGAHNGFVHGRPEGSTIVEKRGVVV